MLGDLIRAEAAYQAAVHKAEARRNMRDNLIRQAVAEGALTQADVARATGLTRGRIAQITNDERP